MTEVIPIILRRENFSETVDKKVSMTSYSMVLYSIKFIKINNDV